MRFFLPVFFLVLISCSDQKEIPVQDKGQFYIEVKINDSITGNFMFDTGAKGLSFDSSFYFSHYQSKEKLQKSQLAGAGTNLQDILVLNDSVKITANDYSKTMYWPIIFNNRKIFGDSCDGIIGWDFFRDKILTINYDEKKLLVSERINNPSSFRKIPFQFIEDKIILKAILSVGNVSIKGDFFLDTGFDGTLALTSKTVTQYNLQYVSDKTLFHKRNGGIGGAVHGFKTKANSLNFEDFEFKNVPLVCLQNESGGLAQPNYEGNIGNTILKRFIVVIDFKSQTLYLKPGDQMNVEFKY